MFRARRIPTIFFAFLLFSTSFLSACEKPNPGFNIHGVNYSGETFSYYVADPAKPDDIGGGELIDPFGAGGTTCCVTLPEKWRSGIKLLVHTTHWLPQRPDGSLPEVKEDHVVEVPPYVDGKAGELWVLRAVDGSVSVISSDFQPDHPKWPGKVKGWPVPSLAYQRERWEIYRKYEADGVDAYVSLLDDLKKNPVKETKEAWEFAKKYQPKSITQFSGPDDPRYMLFLREDYERGLVRSKGLLKQVMENRP